MREEAPMSIRLRGALLVGGAVVLVSTGLGLGLGLPVSASNPATSAPPPNPGTVAPFAHLQHIFVIMMENTGYDTLLTPSNTNTQFIQLMATHDALETDYFGVTHESLPNYVAATSGNTWGSNSDAEAQANDGYLDHTTVFDQFAQSGISWKAYMEGLPYPGYAGTYGDCKVGTTPSNATTPTCASGHKTALYARKHNPVMQYPHDYGNPALANDVVPLTQLTTDLAANTVPQFAWITPNLCNDMHGGVKGACGYPAKTTTPSTPNQVTLYQDGNSFLQTWVTKIMSSRAWKQGSSAIFITWDEGSYRNGGATGTTFGPKDTSGCCDSPVIPRTPVTPKTGTGGNLADSFTYGGGHVPMIVVESHAPYSHGGTGPRDAAPANHYSLLQTIEMNWGLAFLGNASDTLNVHSLAPLLTPTH
jgi:hypothetical protein